MYDIGRVCMKVAGRDAGRMCVIVDEKDGKVLIDGQTRRRLVNPSHLEPVEKKAEIKQGAGHDDVVKALSKLGIKIKEKTNKYTRKPKAEKKEAKKEAKKK